MSARQRHASAEHSTFARARREAATAGDTHALAVMDAARRVRRSRSLQETARRALFSDNTEVLEAGESIDDQEEWSR